VAGVEIATLRLRGPAHLATRAAFRIDDGFRTGLADTERLVLIRRMQAGWRASGERPADRAGAIRLAYSEATRDARHGRDAGDGAFLNCVWFESPAEARRLLLAELLAGRRPTGWFWRLAVPEWRGLSLDEWLGQIVTRAVGGDEEREALSLILLALERGYIDGVARALQVGSTASPPPPVAIRRLPRGEAGREDGRSADRVERAAALRETLAELRARLPIPVRDRIEALVRRLLGFAPVLRLLERLLLQASPSLALAPEQARELAQAWSELLASPATAPLTRERMSAPPVRATPKAQPQAHIPPESAIAPPIPPDEPAMAGQAPRAAELPVRAPEPLPTTEIPLVSPGGEMSDAAGLWLVIPSLIRLGFREWLCERPALLPQDAGRMMLRALARRHRVPDGDPALSAFAALDEIGEIPVWAESWRRGLDGWLRRRARMPLHRLVWKRGELIWAEDKLIVRFPPESADIRLRRRALDVDPGWVDWLGLSVRYRYEERGR
jgi:hypothetical protein